MTNYKTHGIFLPDEFGQEEFVPFTVDSGAAEVLQEKYTNKNDTIKSKNNKSREDLAFDALRAKYKKTYNPNRALETLKKYGIEPSIYDITGTIRPEDVGIPADAMPGLAISGFKPGITPEMIQELQTFLNEERSIRGIPTFDPQKIMEEHKAKKKAAEEKGRQAAMKRLEEEGIL